MSIEPKAYFLFGDGDVHVEPTLATAAGLMEPIDVENGEYDAVFDDSGRRYAFSVVDGNTCLEPTNDVELDELKSRLGIETMSLCVVSTSVEELVDLCRCPTMVASPRSHVSTYV